MNDKKLAELKSRCEQIGWSVWDLDGQLRLVESRFEGREVEWDYEVFIDSGIHAAIALQSGFERYSMADRRYNAIWSAEPGVVECEPKWLPGRPVDNTFRLNILLRETMEAFGRDPNDVSPENRVHLPSPSGIRVTLGPCSEAFAIYYGDFDNLINPDNQEEFDFESFGNDRVLWFIRSKFHDVYRLTLRVEGASLSSEQEALDLLADVGGAALFELDCAYGIGLSLPIIPPGFEDEYAYDELLSGADVSQSGRQVLDPPKAHRRYEQAPLSLYWHARSMPELPLNQFLTYYQVLEYHLPAYSRTKATAAVQKILRGIYGEATEAHAAAVLRSLGGNNRALGGERDQLRNLVRECVSEDALKQFLSEETRHGFYGSPHSLEISNIGLTCTSEDLSSDAARRVYQIRNRIVHTKSEHDDLDPILPTDPQVKLLRQDISLVRFLARRVLSASSVSVTSR